MIDNSPAPAPFGPLPNSATIEDHHGDVERATHHLTVLHGDSLACRPGCASCCHDELSVFTVEADAIRRRFDDVLQATPHPVGRCAFLDPATERCRIYAARPSLCRAHGLPVRWIDDDGAGGLAEFRDICELSADDIDVMVLSPDACWTIGPYEEKLQAIQRDHQARPDAGDETNNRERVALRSLFY